MKPPFCMRGRQQVQMSRMGKWKSSWGYCTWVSFTEGQCVGCFDEKFILHFWLWWTRLWVRSLWKHFSSYI